MNGSTGSPLKTSSVITRYAGNPVLSHKDVPYQATLIFNAGVCKYQGRYVMVFRNDFGRWEDPKFDGDEYRAGVFERWHQVGRAEQALL